MDALFVLDPLAQIDPRADTSYVMITEALRRGHRPYATTLEGLSLHGSEAWVYARAVAPAGEAQGAPLVEQGEARSRTLASFEVVLMRKDPPVDADFVAATWILARAKSDTLVLNDPIALLELNEKLSMLAFPELIPDTRVLRRGEDVREALRDMGGHMIVKPLLGYGGREVLQAREGDPNLSTIIEMATAEGGRWTVAQAFVPEAAQGDKRILLVEGEPIGAVLRVPAKGELRGNLHTGGTGVRTHLNDRDLEICARVGPYLRDRGVFFAGIDVLGRHLTEINVTSPTGMQEINRLDGLENDATMQAKFWAGIEAKIQKGL